MSIQIILASTHPSSCAYLARDGAQFFAGRSEHTAIRFLSAQAVYDHFYDAATSGDHGAWSICYEVQDLIDSE